MPTLLAFLGGQELLIIFVALLVLFGASRLPKLARSMGSSVSEFKKGIKEGSTALDEDDDETKASE